MAVVANTRLPHTIGLELATPGIGVFHLMFLPVAASHSVTACCPSPLPALPSPRNDGQLRAPVSRVMAGALATGAGGGGGADAAGVGCAAASVAVTRASSRFAGPCTRRMDSTSPPRWLNVSVA